jgi:hypothetical protein
MAITKSTITLTSPWTRADMLTQMQSAFATLGWHGGPLSGLGLSLTAVTGGGTVSAATYDYYYSVPTTGGSGSGCTVTVYRNGSGVVSDVYLEKPGSGYVHGETLTVSASEIGGTSNGASNLTFELNVKGGASPSSHGTTSTFFHKDVNGTYPWGVIRHEIDSSKTYGYTYRAFKSVSDTELLAFEGNSFLPHTTDNTADNKWGYGNSFRGTTPDLGISLEGGGSQYGYNSQITDYDTYSPRYLQLGGYNTNDRIKVAQSTGFNSNLNLYRSGLDSNFVVFSWHQPSMSSSDITDNMGSTMIFHNFNSDLWDYDYVYSSGYTMIIPEAADGDDSSRLLFRTYPCSQGRQYRASMCGYFWNYQGSESSQFFDTAYKSNFSSENRDDLDSNYYGDCYMYARNADNTSYGENSSSNKEHVPNDANTVKTMPSATFFNSVLKGIPLSTRLAPVPYYIPDDFGLIQFQIGSNYQNINQGDTITISGSEVWTVITGSYYHDSTRDMTSGVVFCARTT